jgi:phosphatidylinositol kinase/protein kinase (PI-3  family)
VIEEFKKRSIYRELKSWRIAHLMVKTGDDLKQGNFLSNKEQFAMQLINNIANIFEKEKIDCVVFPYEVISLGPNYGLI